MQIQHSQRTRKTVITNPLTSQNQCILGSNTCLVAAWSAPSVFLCKSQVDADTYRYISHLNAHGISLWIQLTL
jgi:hypothetical protein